MCAPLSGPLAEELAQHGIFWLTKCIAQGGYPFDEDFKLLHKAGITHLFNVDLPYASPEEVRKIGFKGIIWVSVVDGRPIPEKTAISCIQSIHNVLHQQGTKLFLHCHAGMNRSPTVAFLYFVSLGMNTASAADLITKASPHAVPGHPALCNHSLLQSVQAYGRQHFIPSTRPEILQPW